MHKIFVSLIALLLTALTAHAGPLTIEVHDTVNPVADVAEYRIYQKIGDLPFDTSPLERVDPASPTFSRDYADGDCYTLAATAVDQVGQESAKSQELTFCMDADGNPTFPNGPSPPTMKVLR